MAAMPSNPWINPASRDLALIDVPKTESKTAQRYPSADAIRRMPDTKRETRVARLERSAAKTALMMPMKMRADPREPAAFFPANGSDVDDDATRSRIPARADPRDIQTIDFMVFLLPNVKGELRRQVARLLRQQEA
jgi:hypothetical protein